MARAISIGGIRYCIATSADVPAMARCRTGDPEAGVADPRMTAYFEGRHHPQQALMPRTGYIAFDGDTPVGYVAGHRSTRHGCAGEVQYLFVAPAYRRRGIATTLLQRLAGWFLEQGARKVCVNVAPDSPAAQPFYESVGASPIRKFWYAWDDIALIAD